MVVCGLLMMVSIVIRRYRIERLKEENCLLKERQPPISEGLPLQPGAAIFHPLAPAMSTAPAAAPAATSTPMENRCFGGMASADPFPPASEVVRPHPIYR